MTQLDDRLDESVTRRLVSVAADHAGSPALVGGPWSAGLPGGGRCSYATLAAIIQAAAAGLTWRGLRPRDVVGVIVPDVVGFVLAAHAVRAAGGVPSPVDTALLPAETAGQLAEAGARMIITAPPLADVALAAADRSWVRQVFSFGDAPGATRFADLLGPDMIRPSKGRPDDVALLPFSRGHDGRLRPAPVTHADLVRQLDEVARRAAISDEDVILAPPPIGDGMAYAMLIDASLLRGATVASVGLDELAAATVAHHGTAVIVPADTDVSIPATLRALPVGLAGSEAREALELPPGGMSGCRPPSRRPADRTFTWSSGRRQAA